MSTGVIDVEEMVYREDICEGIEYCVESKGRQPPGCFEAVEVFEYVKELVEDFKPGVFEVEFGIIFRNTEPLKKTEEDGVICWKGYEPDF